MSFIIFSIHGLYKSLNPLALVKWGFGDDALGDGVGGLEDKVLGLTVEVGSCKVSIAMLWIMIGFSPALGFWGLLTRLLEGVFSGCNDGGA